MKHWLIFCVLIGQLAQAASSDFKILYGPYLQAVGEHEATIVWVTNDSAVSWVEIAPDDKTHFYVEKRPQYFCSSFGKKKIGKVHSVRIPNLESGTKYRYRIYSKEVKKQDKNYVEYGKVQATDVFRKKPLTFTTLDAGKKDVSFWVVNDVHARTELLESMTKDIKDATPDFIVFNGDMVSHMLSQEQIFDSFMNSAANSYASELPLFYARGNHETRGPFALEFIKYFPTNNGKLYYTFRQGPVYFIVLDCGEDKPDDDIEYYGLADYTPYTMEEAAWLKDVIHSREYKEAPLHVVITHIPPVGNLWYGGLLVRDNIVPLLNEAKVDLMLCGHLHRHYYYDKGKDGCDFPIIINSNENVLKVEAGDGKIKVDIEDSKGVNVKTLHF